jgi:hypothetical protein
MIIDDPKIKDVIKQPKKYSKMWRYLDLPKFISLLHENLFFVQSCKLPDKFEGSWSKTDKGLDKYLKELKQYTCISCWQKNKSESALMWEVYPRSDNGIAIQSTFNRLRQSVEGEKRDLYAGEVHYTNDILETKPKFTMEPFFRKRIYFKDDHEIRVIYQEMDKGIPHGSTIDCVKNGTYINVDLNKLIQNIYISPKAEKWFPDLVKSIVDKYELDKKVIKSPLGDLSEDFEDEDTSEGIKADVDFRRWALSTDSSGNISENNTVTTQKHK